MDLFLKTKSEEALWQSLFDTELATQTEEGAVLSPGVSLDIIGSIEDTTGFHANLRLTVELTEEQLALLPSIEAPETPVRVWL